MLRAAREVLADLQSLRGLLSIGNRQNIHSCAHFQAAELQLDALHEQVLLTREQFT